MQRYKDFAPTCFDSAGAFLDDDRQDWIVAPVGQTRDSKPLDESNFAAALALLGGESDTVEVHRFGHWGPGWFEIILVDPARESDVQAIADKLESYPVLDDDDFSEREHEEAEECWDNYARSDWHSKLRKAYPDSEMVDDLSSEHLLTLALEYPHDSFPSYQSASDGAYFDCLRDDFDVPSLEEIENLVNPKPDPAHPDQTFLNFDNPNSGKDVI